MRHPHKTNRSHGAGRLWRVPTSMRGDNGEILPGEVMLVRADCHHAARHEAYRVARLVGNYHLFMGRPLRGEC